MVRGALPETDLRFHLLTGYELSLVSIRRSPRTTRETVAEKRSLIATQAVTETNESAVTTGRDQADELTQVIRQAGHGL